MKNGMENEARSLETERASRRNPKITEGALSDAIVAFVLP
jgi:hypothetical protein